MRIIKLGITLGILFRAFVLYPSSAQASSFSLDAVTGASAGSNSCQQMGTTTASCGTSQTTTDVFLQTMTASGSASAGYGLLHSGASAGSTCTLLLPISGTCFNPQVSTATSEADFSDLFTITNAPASGALVFGWAVDGGDLADGTAALPRHEAFLTASGDFSTIGHSLEPNGGFSGAVNDAFSIAVPFTAADGTAVLGVSFHLLTEAFCGAAVNTTCSAAADFSNTAVVTGVSVVDSNGQLVPAGGISAASGTNYDDVINPAAVPEPTTLTFVGLGLAARVRRLRSGKSPNV